MKEKREKEILADLEKGYDMMSQKFSATRENFWRSLQFVENFAQSGDRVLDFGCGNGRLFSLFGDKKIEYWGVDVSQKLLKIAQEKNSSPWASFQKISASQTLPLANNFFNCVFSVAVFHHFPSGHAQKMAQELFRVTKKDGKILITFWNLKQKRFWKHFFPQGLFWQKLFRRGKFKGFGMRDILIPFRDGEKEAVFERFHHIFTRREMKKIFKKAGFSSIKIFPIENNLVLVAKK